MKLLNILLIWILLATSAVLPGCDKNAQFEAMGHNKKIRIDFINRASEGRTDLDTLLNGKVEIACIYLPNMPVKGLPEDVRLGIKGLNVWEPIWDESWTLLYKIDGVFDYLVFDQLNGDIVLDLNLQSGINTPCFRAPVNVNFRHPSTSEQRFLLAKFYSN